MNSFSKKLMILKEKAKQLLKEDDLDVDAVFKEIVNDNQHILPCKSKR